MSDGDQSALVAFLSDPATYGLPADTPVRRIETHAANVFLAGDRAMKLKKAIRRPYLDYSTFDLRRFACAREVELNQRTAPQIYVGARAVRRGEDGALTLNGETGVIVDWIVEMNRFADDALADAALVDGRLTAATVADLAASVAAFHHGAEAAPDMGGAETMNWVAQGNLERLYDCIAAFPQERALNLLQTQLRGLARFGVLMESRRVAGFTRRCHGDLHLGNVALLDGAPTLFDAIEFDDRLACVDVLYDFAFLLMDLDHRGRSDLANVALNAYLEHVDQLAEQLDGVAMLPLSISMRATIRAHIEATLALEGDVHQPRADRLRLANSYLQLALAVMDQKPTSAIIAIGGLQGAGKSTLAAALAPTLGRPPGAIVLRADALRKRLQGARPTDRLPESAYTAAASDQVFGVMAEGAHACVRAERPVIADATFLAAAHRAQIARVAQDAGVPFIGLWLDAPLGMLETRVHARWRADRRDVSDADVAVLRRSAGRAPGDLSGWLRLDAVAVPDAVLAAARAALAKSL